MSDLAPEGECDFVTDFAMRLPTENFPDDLGVPTDADLFVPGSRTSSPASAATSDQQETMGAALGFDPETGSTSLEAAAARAQLREERLRLDLVHSAVDGEPLATI